ncbi:hypothetical protein TrRE_jg8083, partial [Triparma retinervis]
MSPTQLRNARKRKAAKANKLKEREGKEREEIGRERGEKFPVKSIDLSEGGKGAENKNHPGDNDGGDNKKKNKNNNNNKKSLEREASKSGVSPYDERARAGYPKFVFLNVDRKTRSVQLTLI